MAEWQMPSDSGKFESGDRIVGVVMWREHDKGELRPHLVILTATESGWEEANGYSLEDCELWAWERDLMPEEVGDGQ